VGSLRENDIVYVDRGRTTKGKEALKLGEREGREENATTVRCERTRHSMKSPSQTQ